MKLTDKTINLLLIILILIILFFITKNRKLSSVIEGLNFDNKNFRDNFSKYGINYDKKTKIMTRYDNQTIHKYDFNSKKSKKIMNNKMVSTLELKKLGFPVPKSINFYPKKEKFSILKQKIKNHNFKYPIVAKPVGEAQGRDVYVGIDNFDELKEKINTKLNNYNEIQIQEEVKGDDFRILVVGEKIIYVLRRIKPFVIGDGKNSIKQLIKNRNKRQIKNKDYETKLMSENYILEQGYKLTDILPKNEKIIISKTNNYHNGSELELVDISNIHQDNIIMFLDILKKIDAKIVGIDYMTDDISKSYLETGKIIELNSNPLYHYKKPIVNSTNNANIILNELNNHFDEKFGK